MKVREMRSGTTGEGGTGQVRKGGRGRGGGEGSSTGDPGELCLDLHLHPVF